MQYRQLGKNGPSVSAFGLGTMGMSGMYGPADRAESLATIHAALDAGVTLLDTGDFYGMGHNELLIREALAGVPREQVILSVKFGGLRDPAGGWVGYDARPQAVKNFLAYSLQRLGVDCIDIYRPARVTRRCRSRRRWARSARWCAPATSVPKVFRRSAQRRCGERRRSIRSVTCRSSIR